MTKTRFNFLLLIFVFFLISVSVGFRADFVGSDTPLYTEIYNSQLSQAEPFVSFEYLYNFLSMSLAFFGLNVHVFFTLISLLGFIALVVFSLPYRNPLTHPAVCMRKSALLDVGGYKFGFTGEDYELWLRLMMAGKRFHNLDQELLLYRRHDLQMTSAAKDYVIFCEVSSMLFMYFLKTKQLKFFLGAVSKIPLVRKVKNFIKKATS
jgi:hypothetical protein